VILWDTKTRERLGEPLITSTAVVYGLSFSPDGSTLASSDEDGNVNFWDLNPSSWVASARLLAGRNLSLAEWKQYVGPDVPYHRTCPDLPLGKGVSLSAEPTQSAKKPAQSPP
jgi:WD40 repeat protein